MERLTKEERNSTKKSTGPGFKFFSNSALVPKDFHGECLAAASSKCDTVFTCTVLQSNLKLLD